MSRAATGGNSLAEHRRWLKGATLAQIEKDVIDSYESGTGAEGWLRQGRAEYRKRTGRSLRTSKWDPPTRSSSRRGGSYCSKCRGPHVYKHGRK